MSADDWHLLFGFLWLGVGGVLVLSVMGMSEHPYGSRADSAQSYFILLCLVLIVVGVAGRLMTPGAFWHS